MMTAAMGLKAQSRDWAAVKQIAPETMITVKADGRHSVMCLFQRANETELICEPRMRAYYAVEFPDYRFGRRHVREVRLERSNEENAAVGGLVGAGVGAAAGALGKGNGTVTRGGAALMMGGIGALLGGTFGHTFHVLRGEVIYRR